MDNLSDGTSFNKKLFQSKLLAWFDRNGRDLPWRRTYLPYHIWISEIMLQQTQMDRGVEYFKRWIRAFPDISSIIKASEDQLLKQWEGLGYYSRARNIARSAAIIVRDHGGMLPDDHGALLKLPGIGRYTAGAIMSLAFNREYAIVDGNVERVFSRLFDIDSPVKDKNAHAFIWRTAKDLIPRGRARQFNQALMELGALVCAPQVPSCPQCPVNEFCLAYQRGTTTKRPVPAEKKKTVPLTMVAAFLVSDGNILICKRPEGQVWAGLWEFPGGRLEKGESHKKGLVRRVYEKTGLTVGVGEKVATVKHSYTVHRVTLSGYLADIPSEKPVLESAPGGESRWVNIEELPEYAFSAGHRQLSEHAQRVFFRSP